MAVWVAIFAVSGAVITFVAFVNWTMLGIRWLVLLYRSLSEPTVIQVTHAYIQLIHWVLAGLLGCFLISMAILFNHLRATGTNAPSKVEENTDECPEKHR